jgi:hypothetical protein
MCHVHSARWPLLAYWTCPEWLWWWRIWWNKDWQGKPKFSEKTCLSATSFTINPTCQTRARNRAAAVGSQRLAAWPIARPNHILLKTFLPGTDEVGPYPSTALLLFTQHSDCLMYTTMQRNSGRHVRYTKLWRLPRNQNKTRGKRPLNKRTLYIKL